MEQDKVDARNRLRGLEVVAFERDPIPYALVLTGRLWMQPGSNPSQPKFSC